MNIGKMDRRVTMQTRTLTKDTTGTRVETWETTAEIWAEYVTNKGNVSTLADAERPQDTQQFRIRWRTFDVTNNRIIYDGKTYNPTGVTQEGRRNTLLIDTLAIKGIS